MVHQQTKVLEWDVNEFEPTKKSRDWYWGLGIAAVVGIVLSIIFQNYLLAIFILIAGLLVFMYANKSPEVIHVEISQQGVRVRKDLFPYTNLQSFWIIYKEDQPSLLLLKVDRIVNPLTIVPVHQDIDLTDLREWFMAHIPEEEIQEPLAHQISDRLGF